VQRLQHYLLLSITIITGTWNPANISTAAAGTTTYTFTPDAGQCASAVSIDITIAAQVTPVFTAIGPLALVQQLGIPAGI
jgi:hypothetical protein